MNINILLPLIIILATCINACSPSPKSVTTEIVTVEITATPQLTNTFTTGSTNTPEPSPTKPPTKTPTLTATPTKTPITTLEGLSIPVPDPRITNPELLNLTNPNASIPKLVNAMKVAGIECSGPQKLDSMLNRN